MKGHLLAILCGLLLTAAACAQEENLLANPGFEEVGDDGWATGWDIWPDDLPQGATLSVDDEVAHEGGRSLRITHTASAYTRAQQSLTVKPNTEYIFSAWIRCEDVFLHGESMGARLYIVKSTGDRAAQHQLGTRPWTRVQIGPVDVGDTGSVSVLLYLHQATGTAWFDNVQAIEVTDAVRRGWEQERFRERLRADIEQVRALAERAGDEQALARLAALSERAETEDIPTEVDYRTGPPWFPLHGEILAVAAEINRRRLSEGGGPVHVWTTDPFEPFPAVDLVPDERELRADVMMCLDEREQALIRLCNVGDAEVTARLTVPRTAEDAPALTVREVRCIDPGHPERAVPMKGDPLPLAEIGRGGAPVMSLQPGVIRAWWLQLDSHGARPGMHRLPLTVTPSDGPAAEVELRVRVLPMRMPPDKPIVTWNYSYEHEWIMPERWEHARRDLAAHHINAFCWPHTYLPWPQLDEDGALQLLDWTRFDAGLRTHDNVRWLLLWPGFEWDNHLALKLELEPGSDRWREVFIAWFTAMREGLAERGFGPDRVAWYLSDEPCNRQRATAVKLTGEVIREIAPDAYVLANPYSAATQELLDLMDPVVNLWCPSLGWATGDLLRFFQEGSEVLWSYQVLWKGNEPFGAYRLSFWDCWDRGMSGQGFWSYADATGSNWNPHDNERHEYAPIYDGDGRELIPSIRWEAWREGVEDYTLLTMASEAGATGAIQAAEHAVTERSLASVNAARRAALLSLRRAR